MGNFIIRKYTFAWIIFSLSFVGKLSFAGSITDTESLVIAAKVNSLNGSTRIICSGKMRCGSVQLSDFYSQRNFMPVWTMNGQIKPEANELLTILEHSYQDGLNPPDYHVTEINDLEHKILLSQKQPGGVDVNALADLDVTLSDAYLLYTRHMRLGKINPVTSYPGWFVSRNSANILESYEHAIISKNLITTLNQLEPSYIAYKKLKEQLAAYQQIAGSGGWQTIPNGKVLKLGVQESRVVLLQKRLVATGNYQSVASESNKFTTQLKDAVSQFQAEHGLKVNGTVDKTTLQVLNIPVESQIKQIELNMDRLRWLPNDLGSPYILVNIPNYSLSVVESNHVLLAMPVIVGRGGENKTCVINSKITSLELNPYWGVPHRIATKEYLADIQKNPTYLEQHDMRVFDLKTNQEVDPTGIDWHDINQNNFNYFLRQDPGKKNALGKLKFLFSNDCGIYLHDTPSHNLFGNKLRSLSHGCVRLSQPMQLANYLLESDPSWSSTKLESAIQTGKHRWVKLANPISLHIVYQTLWVDENNRLQFRNDIYKADAVNFPVFIPQSQKVK